MITYRGYTLKNFPGKTEVWYGDELIDQFLTEAGAKHHIDEWARAA